MMLMHQGYGGRGGGGRGSGRGDYSVRGGHGHGGAPQEKPKKEAILNLAKYVDKEIRVKFMGGREGMYRILGWQYRVKREWGDTWVHI